MCGQGSLYIWSLYPLIQSQPVTTPTPSSPLTQHQRPGHTRSIQPLSQSSLPSSHIQPRGRPASSLLPRSLPHYSSEAGPSPSFSSQDAPMELDLLHFSSVCLHQINLDVVPITRDLAASFPCLLLTPAVMMMVVVYQE